MSKPHKITTKNRKIQLKTNKPKYSAKLEVENQIFTIMMTNKRKPNIHRKNERNPKLTTNKC